MEPTATPPWRVLDASATGDGPGAAAAADPSGRHLPAPAVLKVVLTAGGAVACAALAFVLAVAGGPAEAVVVDGGAPLPIAGASGSVGPEGGADPAGAGDVVVEIVGAVPRPGVFHLPAGSRVGDLLAAAGGYGRRVDTARAEQDLNLAATLRDGDQVRVPSRDDAPAGATGDPGGGGGSTGALVDLNRATQAELEALPGIGPATAQKIIAAREEAPFAAVEELRTRGVLGEKTFEKLRELVTVH